MRFLRIFNAQSLLSLQRKQVASKRNASSLDRDNFEIKFPSLPIVALNISISLYIIYKIRDMDVKIAETRIHRTPLAERERDPITEKLLDTTWQYRP